MSKSKDKAEELVLKYLRIDNNTKEWFNTYIAKQCAIVTINEIIAIKLLWYQKDTKDLDYWQEVKTEIQKL